MVISYFNYLWDIEGISAGSANKAKELLQAINNLGHTTYLEWRTPQPNGQLNSVQQIKEVLKPKLQKYIHEPKRLIMNFRNLFEEYRILKRQSPDILFNRLELYTVSPTWLSQWLHFPMVVEADCPPTYEYMQFYGKNHKHLGNLASTIEMLTLHNADAIIAISNILKDYYIEQGIMPEKIHVIPNGADPEKFRPTEKSTELVRKYNLQEKVVIGWIGSLVGWSGIENLISLALYVLEKYPNVVFMMIGGGANKEFFQQKLHIKNYAPRVILPGTISHEEVRNYLSCIDIAIAPYPKLPFWYPSSMKIFEYMAAAKAIIASDVGQIGEVILNGENGMLFDPDSSEELIKVTVELLENESFRWRIGKQARKDLLDKYTWEQHAKKIIAIFEEILQKRKKEQSGRIANENMSIN